MNAFTLLFSYNFLERLQALLFIKGSLYVVKLRCILMQLMLNYNYTNKIATLKAMASRIKYGYLRHKLCLLFHEVKCVMCDPQKLSLYLYLARRNGNLTLEWHAFFACTSPRNRFFGIVTQPKKFYIAFVICSHKKAFQDFVTTKAQCAFAFFRH